MDSDAHDSELRAPLDPLFTELVLFLCTYEAQLTNICQTHAELIQVLEPAGAAKALNCNFGHKAQPGFGRFLKLPRPPRPPQARNGIAPANVRQRKPQGDATCFNSALEIIIIPGPEDEPPPAVQAVLEAKPDKYYAVKCFPTTGKMQVPGVISPGLEDGAFVARLCARYLTRAGVGADPGRPVEIGTKTPGGLIERPILANYKFSLRRRSERVVLALKRIAEHLAETRGPGGRVPGLPFPVREIKMPQDGQNMSFKVVVANEPKLVKLRVNIFFRGKINILGSSTPASSRAIHRWLAGYFRENWPEFVHLTPLPDRQRAARRKQATPPAIRARRPPPAIHRVDPTVPRRMRVSDAELAAIFSAAGPAEPENKPAAPAAPGSPLAPGSKPGPRPVPFALADLEQSARGFEAEFGGAAGRGRVRRPSDDAALTQVEEEDVEEDQKDALHRDSI